MRIVLLAILAGVCVGGCAGSPDSRDYDDYPKPSPLLEKEIRDRIAALEFESGVRLLKNQRRLAYIREAAVPYLVRALRHTSPLVRGSCAYILGEIRDIRTLPELRRVAEEDESPTVRYEAAAALVAIGDTAHGYPVLVEGLGDTDIRNRYKCFEILKERTALTFGYEHDASAEDRQAAMEQWRAWVEKAFP